MTTRNCNGCRHFTPAGFDNMGWCNHPKRKLSSDAKVFVRGAQLPCRNDWAVDLFEERRDEPGSDGLVGLMGLTPTQPSMPLIAEKEEDWPSAVSSSNSGTIDKVVGETTKVVGGDRFEVDRMPLRRAHEELRAKKRFELGNRSAPERFALGIDDFQLPGGMIPSSRARPDPRTPSFADGAIERNDADMGLIPADVSAINPPPVRRDDVSRQFPKISAFLDDDDHFSSIPAAVDGFELPRPQERSASSVIRTTVGEGDFDRLFPSVSAGFAEAENVAHPRTEDGSRARRSAADDRSGRRSVLQPTFDGGVEGSIPSASAAAEAIVKARDSAVSMFTADEPDEWSGADLLPPDVTKPEIPGRSRLGRFRRSRVNTSDGTDAPEIAFDIMANADQAAWIAPALPLTDDFVNDMFDDAEEQPVGSALWAAVPRACRTCRDFRPSESGDRGWCTNKWAFSHRRMVDADDIPCESSVGCWWLPHDDVWMSTADVSEHSQPTPLFDLWIAARYAVEVEQETLRHPERTRQRS